MILFLESKPFKKKGLFKIDCISATFHYSASNSKIALKSLKIAGKTRNPKDCDQNVIFSLEVLSEMSEKIFLYGKTIVFSKFF